MPPEYLTLQAAADELGVHYMTVYRYVRLGQLPAHKVGGGWRVAHADLHSFQQEKASDDSRGVSRGNVDWGARLEAALLAGDQVGSWQVVEAAMASGVEPIEVYTTMLVPALRSVGERWASGDLSVADEHVASAVAARLIGRLGPRFSRRGRSRGIVVVAAPPGEWHGLGVSMSADVLRGSGYDVVDLGVNTPVDALRSVLASTGEVRGVAFGAATPETLPGAVEMVAAAREIVDPPTVVVLGGGALTDDHHARRLGADAKADVASVASVIDSLATRRGRSTWDAGLR